MVVVFTAEDFLYLGLTNKGFSEATVRRTGKTTNEERFRAFYYCAPETCEYIFQDLQVTEDLDAQVSNPDASQFLLGLNYLKEYPTKYGLAAYLDSTEKTALKWAEYYVRKIAALKYPFYDPNNEEIFMVSVDGIHCRIHEPRVLPSSSWYSKKFNKAGLVYELGIAIFHNQPMLDQRTLSSRK